MSIPFAESIKEYDTSLSRLRKTMSFVATLIKTSPPLQTEQVIVSATPRHMQLTLGGKSIFKKQLPHRIYWQKPQHVIVADTPESEHIKFGVTGSGELVVKHPVVRDVNGNAVLIRSGAGLTELRSTYQVIYPDDLEPAHHTYIDKGLTRTLRHLTELHS